MSDNPGMMGEAYFVGKRQLLDWINSFLDLNYTKVEQAASGAAHCQILDAIFPGKVPLTRVNFDAKYDYEFVKNFKVLQGVFQKMDVQKHVPVEKLIKAKYQDNLEFLQWMKNFFDVRYSGDEYDAIGRRNAALKKQGKKLQPRAPKLTGPRSEGKRATTLRKTSKLLNRTGGTKVSTGKSADTTGMEKRLKEKDKIIKEKEEKLNELSDHVELLEKERTFYYSKLRSIEILLQDHEEEDDGGVKDKILEILYQTDEGFEAPPEDPPAEEA
eukprot:jgi/Bigna1/129275/aug1.8_g3983